MKVVLTAEQGVALRLDQFNEFVRAAFFTGHSFYAIQELISGNVYATERATIINLAVSLGMTDEDTVETSHVDPGISPAGR